MRRHLLYHCCPVSGNDAWRWNVQQLRARLSLFDGRRLVGVVQGEGLDDAGEVAAALGPGVEYRVMPNAMPAGEGVTFGRLLPELHGQRGSLWYGHAKGVSQHNQGARVYPVRRWAECCYRSTLDYWPLVEQMLDRHPLVGSFRRVGVWPGKIPSWWHYAGTYFWVRLPWLWTKRWRDLADGYGCVERWPGQVCSAAEAGVLYYSMPHDSMRLYTEDYWRQVGDVVWQRWTAENACWLQPPLSQVV